MERTPTRDQSSDDREATATPRKPWVKPRLEFVEPRLTSHGEFTKVTGAFFGAFSPGAND